MTPQERKERIQNLQQQILELQLPLDALKDTCPHTFKPLTQEQQDDPWMSEGARCTTCDTYFGWRCKVSPDQVCHYHTEDGKVVLINNTKVDPPKDHDPEYETYDNCIFCHHPEERK
jgi:hypothetical protein